MPRSVRWILGGATVAVIATLPLTWVPAARVGGFELRLPYAVALAQAALLLLVPAQLAIALRHVPPTFALWLMAYTIYLLLLFFGLAGGDSSGMVVRQGFFMACGCAFALSIVALRADPRVLRAGGLLAVLGFVGLSEILAWQLGLSWASVIQKFLSTGNLEFVFYQFLKGTFQLVLSAGEEAQASDKNAVSVALLVALFLFRAGFRNAGPDRFGQFFMLSMLLILVILNTRSVLLMAAICLPLAGWVGAMRDGVRDPGEFILKTVFFAGLMLAGILVMSMDSGAASAIGDRFSFDDASSANRIDQYTWALERIESSIVQGAGTGEFRGQPVHNLFLGAWMHAGLPAFVIVVFAYLSLVVGCFVFLLRVVTDRGFWVLPVRAEWVVVLPFLPMFRVWIAGDSGHPSFVEWIALSAFFALLHANRVARAETRFAPSIRPLHPSSAHAHG